MHVTSPLGLVVPASYDEYTALVKSGTVASEQVKRAVSGKVLLVETWMP